MINAISTTTKRLWIVLICFILFLIIPIFTLLHGVYIENFSILNVKIQNLHVKLDKKLTISIDNLQIKNKNSKQSSSEELMSILKNLPWLDRLFYKIDLKKIQINNNTISILYQNDIFYFDTNYLHVSTNLSVQKNEIKAKIKKIILKDYNLSLSGQVEANLHEKELVFKGKFSTFNINGDILMYMKNDILSYALSTDSFDNLTPFLLNLSKKVKMDKELVEWLAYKITAKSFTLSSLEGQFNIKNYDFYPFKMKGKVKLKNAKIKFHKDVSPVLSDALDIELKNNTLFLNLKNSKYQNKALLPSHAKIYNLLTSKNGIILNINANIALDDSVQQILKAYKLNIPILQQSGYVDTSMHINIVFVPYDIDVNGTFNIKDSQFLISNVPFGSKNANIFLDNNILNFTNTNLIYKDIFDITTSGILDFHKNIYDGNITLANIKINANKTNLLDLNSTFLPINMNFLKDNFSISLPSIYTKLSFLKDDNIIELAKISTIYKYSDFLQKANIYEGNITIFTKDFDTYKINADIKDMKAFLRHNDKNITSEKLDININESINIKSLSDTFSATIENDNTFIDINNSDILLDFEKNSSNMAQNVTLHAKKSNIFLTEYNTSILLDNFQFDKKNTNINFIANYKNADIAASKTKNSLHVKALRLNSDFINTLIGKNVFQNGIFGFKLDGVDENNLTGYVNFKNTFLKDLKTYNNLLAFINSIPSLVTFKKPGFNELGYNIKEAKIYFKKQNNIINIYAARIDGEDSDIDAKGEIDLNSKKINLIIALKTFKSLSGAVKHIPIVNYILLGEDESIATTIKISGTIDNPIIKTQALKDTAIIPIDILKRTLTLPFNLFD